ncbi:SAM-dependent methyltransferase [Pectobacterium polaris]|uniref:SAM-dependent methyltransferase n=1 Tax=Pectobacterium polaris TaxID=2042057 RepID=UPI000EA3A2BE|nr:SAM-dependent methyltransferase [Pectobacterium polaris]RJL21386.1 SAM-dependent methyltransferase [Pectobacterium polaris]
MNVDFLDSHRRHLDDANNLFTGNRFANADQLYGFSVECGLKSLMLAFGMPFDSAKERPAEFDDRVHADKIWDRFESYRSSHSHGANYLLKTPNPFHDWSASQRYDSQNNYDVTRVTPHQSAAKVVEALVKQATLEGFI